MNKREGTTVRLTPQAHILLTEKAADYSMKGHKISMKDIASEAIFLLFQSEDRDKEVEASVKLQKRLPIYLFISAAVGTVAGVILGMML